MLFKDELNIDLAEIKQYLSVSQNGSYAKIKPHIAAAEILYIKDLLGEALYTKLHDWYHSEESGSLSGSDSISASVSASVSASTSVSPSIIAMVALSGSWNGGTNELVFQATAVDHADPDPTFFWYVGPICVNSEEGEPGYTGPHIGNTYPIGEGDLYEGLQVKCMTVEAMSVILECNFNESTWSASGILEEDNSGSIIIIDDPFPMRFMNLGPELSGSLSASNSQSIQVETPAALAAILSLVQNVLINFSYYIGADEFGVHVSDAGIQIISDETHKQAFQWQVNAAKNSWLNKAYLFSDVLLSYLESHSDEYPSWKNSECFTKRLDSLLYTTGQFNDEYFIKNSRRLFLALKPIIRSIESKYAMPTLSQAYYDALLTSIRAGSVSADDQVILKKIRPAIAHLAMAEAITRFAFEVFPEAVYANIVSAFGTIDGKNPAGKIDKALAVDSLNSEGNSELAGLQKYLDANASSTKYSTYFASSRYSDPTTTPNRSEFINNSDKGICVI